MKLIDGVLVLALAGILLISWSNGVRLIQQMNQSVVDLHRQATADFFISESFKNTCKGKGFKNLNEWQKSCRAMWNLEYIGWGNAEDFMQVDYTFSTKPLFYGKWDSHISSGEVYCRKD